MTTVDTMITGESMVMTNFLGIVDLLTTLHLKLLSFTVLHYETEP